MKDQVRDLMFYLETQKKIEDSPDGARQVCAEGCGMCGYVALTGDPGRSTHRHPVTTTESHTFSSKKEKVKNKDTLTLYCSFLDCSFVSFVTTVLAS